MTERKNASTDHLKTLEIFVPTAILAFANAAFAYMPYGQMLGATSLLTLALIDLLAIYGLVRWIQSRISINALTNSSVEKRLEEVSASLKESKVREKAILDHAADVICVIDVNCKFVSINPTVEKTWGYKAEELIGSKVSDITRYQNDARTLESVLGSQYSVERLVVENQIHHKNGKWIDALWTAQWSVSDDGLFCIVRDITEAKAAQLRLQESEERVRTTLESMPSGIVCTNSFAAIETVNAALLKMTGGASTQLLGKQLEQLFIERDRNDVLAFVKKIDTDLTLAPLRTSLISGAQMAGEGNENVQATSTTLPIEVELTGTPFTLGGKKKFLIVVNDITERVEIERMRQHFIAMVNHDLKAPLTSLAGTINILQEGRYGDLGNDGREMCKLANSEIGRLMRLVNDLLDLERIESGNLRLDKAEIAALEIIETSVFSMKPYAEIRKLKIEYPETEAACWADKSRITQVLINLLSNAIKFSPEDSVVSISVEELADGIKFSVQDRGRGIPADKASALFQRFKQVQPDNPLEQTGSGLGLSISKAIVDAHAGKIGFESQAGQGSCFWFTLPSQESNLQID